jgi:hypothetical protein
LLGALVLLSTVAVVPSATADPGHERPKITVFRFQQPPLKSGINETLKVVAHDPDSWISEIQVSWADAAGDGGVVFAHTFCVQDPDFSDPGTPAVLKIPIMFEKPGSYHLEARAISEIECQGGNETRFSRTLEKTVEVTDPAKTMNDPDDSAGALDIASLEQTQESSETSATTEIVHRLTMFEAWSNDALAGNGYIEMYLDTDDDEDVERILTVDMDEQDSTLFATMLDPFTGQSRGYARVRRPDDKTLEVSFPPAMVAKGLRSYEWNAYVDSGEADLCPPTQTCTDNAPDSGLLRHRL